MQHSNKKVIISDLDGTLLNPDHQVSSFTKDILKQVYQDGNTIIIATGRHHLDAMPILKTLHFPFYLVTSNGARIHNPNQELVYQFNLEDSTSRAILTKKINPEITAVLFKEEVWFTNKVNEKLNSFQKEMHYPPQIVNFEKEQDLSGIKIFFMYTDNHVLQELKQDLQLQFSDQFEFAFSLPICLELLHKQIDKSKAIDKILQIENKNWQQTIAFGDGFNDEKMLLAANKALIMNNAPIDFKQKLNHLEVIQSNDQDGVAHYLNKKILK